MGFLARADKVTVGGSEVSRDKEGQLAHEPQDPGRKVHNVRPLFPVEQREEDV